MSTEQRPDDELVAEDDAVIGQAFRRSLLVLVLAALAVAAFALLGGEDEAPEEVREKDAGEISDLVTDEAALPEVTFTEVTAEAGIDFLHRSGAEGGKYLPETMGGGAAFFDFDGDGAPDLFLVSSEPGGVGRLYRNAGGRSREVLSGGGWEPRRVPGASAPGFTDVTAESGIAPDGRIAYGMGVTAGDFDGDGDADLFLTGVGGNRLLRNEGGRFEDVSAAAGVAGEADEWTTSAGFFDSDGDGDLDLFVCHYVAWSREIDEELAFTLDGTNRAYGPPTNYAGAFSTLYRNEGDGTFTDVSAEAGIQVTNPATGAPMGKALGVSFYDFDGDGHDDIFVANDTVQNHLFLSRGDGTYDERGFESGAGFDGSGKATGAMGVDVADLRGDGTVGVCVANFANEMTSLYVTRAPSTGASGELLFSDDAMGEGIGSPSRQRLSFGLFYFDYDLDGRPDLLQVNGHLEETINAVQPSQTYLQPPQLFWNAGPDQRSCFVEVPPATTGALETELAGRGSCYADYDGDGDLDVLMMQVGGPPLLMRNDQQLGAHYLRVALSDPGSSNRHALGAWVAVTLGDRVVRQRVSGTKSYLSCSELTLTFGLGAAETIDALEVIWPDGERQAVPPPAVDREVLVERS